MADRLPVADLKVWWDCSLTQLLSVHGAGGLMLPAQELESTTA